MTIREMDLNDFLIMDEKELLGWWIKEQTALVACPQSEDFAEALYSYEAYGRAGVAQVLVDIGFDTTDKPIKEIPIVEAKKILTRMKNKNDFTIFSLDFVKRSTGQLRHMVCRFGVTTALKGGEKAFNDKDHDLKTVYDMQKKSYRSISQESIIRMSIHGQKYVIEENKTLLDRLSNPEMAGKNASKN